MKLIRNIPDIYCNLIEEGIHKPHNDRLTVTELVNPPLVKYLQIKYWDKLEAKASEYLWMILGKAAHQVFESSGIIRQLSKIVDEANKEPIIRPEEAGNILVALNFLLVSHFAEKPVETIIKGTKIRGRIDFREVGIIRDFKITSVWSFLHGIKPDWIKQLNIYAFLAKRNGLPVNELFVDAILRDWSVVKGYRNPDYPKIPFISLKCPLWSEEEQYNFILERIAAYNVEPCECSPEEKWQKETIFAVKKPKAKRATRVFSSEEAALKYIDEHKKNNLEIEIRLGECTRCLLYCPVRKVCPFNKVKK